MATDLQKNKSRFLQSLNDLENIRVTGVKDFHACPTMWRAKILGEGVHRESPYAKRGTAVHFVIEHFLKGCPPTGDWFDSARAILRSEGVPEDEVENTFRYLQTLEPLRDRVIHVEHRVSYHGYAYPLVGHVDAIFRYNDEGDLLILDHKTNRSYRGSDWWSKQPQQRLYAWLVRQASRFSETDVRDIYFAIGYTNLDRRVVWRTDPSDGAWCYDQYMNLIDELEVYKRTSEWPERTNPDCRYCPLKSTCPTLAKSAQVMDAETELERYKRALDRQKIWEAIVEDLRGQILARIAENEGDVVEGGLRARAKPMQRRSITFEDAWDVVAPHCGMPELPTIRSEFEPLTKMFKPQVGELDKFAKQRAGPLSNNTLLEQALEARYVTVEGNPSLIVEEVSDEG